MRKLVHVLIIMFTAWTCHAEITKGDILKTLDHMRQLQQENKDALVHAQADFQMQGAALQKVTESANKWHVEAHRNAKERDVLVYLFSIISGFWLLARYHDFQIPLTPPWKWVIEFGCFIAGFGAAYTAGRFLLTWCAHFIP